MKWVRVCEKQWCAITSKRNAEIPMKYPVRAIVYGEGGAEDRYASFRFFLNLELLKFTNINTHCIHTLIVILYQYYLLSYFWTMGNIFNFPAWLCLYAYEYTYNLTGRLASSPNDPKLFYFNLIESMTQRLLSSPEESKSFVQVMRFCLKKCLKMFSLTYYLVKMTFVHWLANFT